MPLEALIRLDDVFSTKPRLVPAPCSTPSSAAFSFCASSRPPCWHRTSLARRLTIPSQSQPIAGLRTELADARISRTLTLLAKSLQSVGNLGNTIGSGKEEFMNVLSPLLIRNSDIVKRYIDSLCDVADQDEGRRVGS